ncbi:2-oxo-4-hydroxy-4-carboxy-5-ureidoimidazoline decarboxylase [Nocardioides zeae]|uniref:2-oxo-4-hydroxy-4-carboxy-5-ureidoimidazoline decarboxylase n=1 Tax=Nocardioides zeae TaxID=1457234 RepID=A0ACC6ICD7_9ACTN|nr:2-oxo-4-hydroxy-4-carboxy-5-ureidoimidazoline decarboxylase [Nocardioides zeae]MDR6175384.1 2-oxo-4-hydroxy-4-carboxy-5-ureidoimidazoline decarboxylase [Nocardioides zeae]MDR6208317.1 2-oxo-4-hydroxy-4-carboxy-5-ureidoimidazoline decarboxylase [Nocardioides zeae]
MRIDELNALDAATARAALAPAADVGWWLDALVAGRPYADAQALLALAAAEAARWTDADVEGALAHHPRIGERPTGDSAEAALSRREQGAIRSGADASDPADLERAIAAGNAAYEDRFGRVFLIRAAGRSRPEILAELDRRLTNDPDAERAEVHDQLTQIALLRLEGMLEGSPT